MSDKTHTPGPWAATLESIDPDWLIVTGPGGGVVANVNDADGNNARLIAAAPELLDALEALDAGWLEDFPGGPEYISPLGARVEAEHKALWLQIRAAIAKAKGTGQ